MRDQTCMALRKSHSPYPPTFELVLMRYWEYKSSCCPPLQLWPQDRARLCTVYSLLKARQGIMLDDSECVGGKHTSSSVERASYRSSLASLSAAARSFTACRRNRYFLDWCCSETLAGLATAPSRTSRYPCFFIYLFYNNTPVPLSPLLHIPAHEGSAFRSPTPALARDDPY